MWKANKFTSDNMFTLIYYINKYKYGINDLSQNSVGFWGCGIREVLLLSYNPWNS